MLARLRRFVCRVFGHTTFPGTHRERCLYFHCPRCKSLVPGRYALPR